MKIKLILATISLVLLARLAAQAGTVVSPPVVLTNTGNGNTIACVASNLGSTEVDVEGNITYLDGSVISGLTHTIQPGQSYLFALSPGGNGLLWARCEFSFPKGARVRGYILVLIDNETVLSEEAH